MEPAKIKVLLVEDNPGDARLVLEMLAEAEPGRFHVDHVKSIGEAMKRLQKVYFHVVLLDLSLPDADGLKPLNQVQAVAPALPVVVLSGMQDEAVALEAVQAGAQDYLVKGQATGHLLTRSMRYAIERKRSEEVLKRTNQELKELNRMKSSFISTVSHELRTPMTSIKNSLELMGHKKTGALNESQKRFLEMAIRNITRLSRIINDLLDLTRLEDGRVRFQFSDVDLAGVVQHALITFKPQAETQSLKLKANLPPSLPTVYADPARVEQILANLINNAIKFTPGGGRITVSARVVGEEVEVSVKDSGIGLSPEEQAQVFERFYQAGNSRSRSGKGTGLGLYIAKQLVEAQGGSIGVEATRGRGSRFFFTLPVYTPGVVETVALEEELRQYLNYPSFAVLVVQVGAGGTCPEDSQTGPPVARLLDRLSHLVQKTLFRDTDRIIAQPALARLIVLLVNTPRTGAMVVKEKFSQVFSKNSHLFKAASVPVPEILGPASYPEDGSGVDQLIACVRQSSSV